jgi:hypothetical protein
MIIAKTIAATNCIASSAHSLFLWNVRDLREGLIAVNIAKLPELLRTG